LTRQRRTPWDTIDCYLLLVALFAAVALDVSVGCTSASGYLPCPTIFGAADVGPAALLQELPGWVAAAVAGSIVGGSSEMLGQQPRPTPP